METITIEKALAELRKDEKRKFIQSLDIIINLQKFDARKESITLFVSIPHPSQRTLCAVLTRKVDYIDCLTREDFTKFKELKEIKRLAKRYDFFIAAAPLMAEIATKFGRVFGPMGKMPSPQAGIIAMDTDANVKAMIEKMKSIVKIKSKEKSLKIAVGKEDMSDKDLKENIETILTAVTNALPQKGNNIKNVLIKFTMSKPVRIK